MSTNNYKYLVLNLDNSTAWSPISMADMFKNSFTSQCYCFRHRNENNDNSDQICNCNHEKWNIVELAAGEDIPMDVDNYQGIVLTGSRFNCRDGVTLPWFDTVCDIIRNANNNGKPRIYGGCFGCQLIAYALGGKVDYNENKQFILKNETITLDTYVYNQFLLPMNKDSIDLINSHGDYVAELPPHSDLLAYSNSCPHEIFITGKNRNILAVQAHPEFEYQYSIADRIWPSVVDKSGKLSKEEVEESLQSFAKYTDKDARLFLDAVAIFLREKE